MDAAAEDRTDPLWLDDEEQETWRAFIKAITVLDRLLDRDLKPHGLSPEDYGILAMLSEVPDQQLRFGELAETLGVPRPFLTYRFQRLEAAGLVERRTCPTDARGAYLGLTPDGAQRVVDAAPAHVASVRHAVFDHLTREQARQLGEIMRAVLAGVQRTTHCDEA